PRKKPDLLAWEKMVRRINGLQRKLTVALVGKYTSYKDSYTSVIEALNHAGVYHDVEVEVRWIGAEQIEGLATEEEREALFAGVQGIVVPGGFGGRGIEGKIEAARFARENRIPFLGLCLGMHCAILEVARNVCGLEEAHSLEFDPQTPQALIEPLPGLEPGEKPFCRGKMRLGSYPCTLLRDSRAYRAYQKDIVNERHRHGYKLNYSFQENLALAGLFVTGFHPQEQVAEIVELEGHPWYVATQFHPEFKSRPNRPHPLFLDFIDAQLNTPPLK
ncbi:MAG: CTP synthase, partial [Firmicutes bacterium]|nr:CTP synthase [Bacillota bacterium]